MDDDKAKEDLFCEILASLKLTNVPLLSIVDSSATEMMSIGSGVSGGVEAEEEEGKTLVSIQQLTG